MKYLWHLLGQNKMGIEYTEAPFSTIFFPKPVQSSWFKGSESQLHSLLIFCTMCLFSNQCYSFVLPTTEIHSKWEFLGVEKLHNWTLMSLYTLWCVFKLNSPKHFEEEVLSQCFWGTWAQKKKKNLNKDHCPSTVLLHFGFTFSVALIRRQRVSK